jgi:hypothetical protein
VSDPQFGANEPKFDPRFRENKPSRGVFRLFEP